MKIVERIRSDRDSEDLRSAAYYQIERIIDELRNYRYRDSKRLEIQFSVLPRELWHRQVESAWKKRRQTDMEAFFERVNSDDIDSIYGYESDYFKLNVHVVSDYARDIGELSIQPSPSLAKLFIGKLDQVEDVLKLFQFLMAIEIEEGDKAEFYLCDEPVSLSVDYDPSDDIGDTDYGWNPSSPEECLDYERDAFFPNDR